MYKVTRKWKRTSDQAPPCEGCYVYEVINQIDKSFDVYTEKEYKAWKKTVIIENFT